MNAPILSLWRGDIAKPAHVHSVKVSRETLSRTLAAVCMTNPGLKPEELLSGSSKRRIAHPRQEAMWLLRQITWGDGTPRHSLPEIGRALGGLDHTTVLHGIRAHEKRLAKQ